MTRLTIAMRDAIRTKAVKGKFDALQAALAERGHKLALRAHTRAFGKQTVEQARHMPGEWIAYRRTVQYRVNGMLIALTTEQDQPVPHPVAMNISNPTLEPGLFADEVIAHAQDSEQLTKERKRVGGELYRHLERFNTFKALREGWPEGKAVYEPILREYEQNSTLPAVIPDSLNKELGLP